MLHTSSGTRHARLMEYCVGRGVHLGPIGEDFGTACDQLDRADLMLAELHQRARQGLTLPGQQAVDREIELE